MPNLDIRSLSFFAMVSSLLLALGLQVANRIITRDQCLRLWARGATVNGGGYILLALRGIVPDLFSIVLANTLLILGMVWFYLGNRTFRGRAHEFPWYWLLTVISAVLLAYFTYLSPNLDARIITLSASAAAILFPSALILLRPSDRGDRLALGFVATPFFAAGVFMVLRAATALAGAAREQEFMTQTSAIHSLSLMFAIGLNSLLGIGLPLLVAGRVHRLQLELERSVEEHTQALEKANNDLAGREALLSQILDTSSVAIFLLDEGGRIRKANQCMAEMFGYAIDELVGKEYVDLVHPAQREVGRQKMLALVGSAVASVDLDRQYWRGDHVEFWGHLAGRRFYEAKGEANGLIGVITDITERKVAEQRLLQQNQSLSAVIENFPGGISLFDAELRLAAHNEQFKKLLDFPDTLFEKPGLCFEDLIRYNAERGEYGPGDPEQQVATIVERARHFQPHRIERVRPSGLVLDIQGMPLPSGGFVTIYIDITERKTVEEQIKTLAFYDPLTGLPNRRLLMDRLAQSLAASARHMRKGALLFVDLDNFKAINDTVGHFQGDLVLEQVAKRLKACVREGDTVARLGGDEFVVMLEDLSEQNIEAATVAEAIAEKVLATLVQTYQLGSYEHRGSASIGITLFGDGLHESIDEPLKRADLAMYQAKTAGRNTLRFFDPKMQAVVTARAAMEAGLWEALEKRQFLLHYQAQVSGERLITGVEALVRWLHPQRGLVSPAEFIPLSEETGLILPLGRWVLEAACAQLVQWASRTEMADLTISVNVSAQQFSQADFVADVLAVLESTGANPKRLKLELTESLLVTRIESVIAKMDALKARGVGFSLDDFGTGYSSLAYLKRLPLDQLKIDQSFVQDILSDTNDAAIAKMVVVLASSLGLSVIAEGVETEAQRAFLAQQGCHAYRACQKFCV